jgi:hypothetical protein
LECFAAAEDELQSIFGGSTNDSMEENIEWLKRPQNPSLEKSISQEED